MSHRERGHLPIQARQCDPWIRKVPWRRKWHPTPVFLPAKSYGQRILVGYTGHGVAETQKRLSSVQSSRSVVSDSPTPWTTERQASLFIANSWSLLKLVSIKLVIPSNHLILCGPLLLPPSIFPSIRVFSNQ